MTVRPQYMKYIILQAIEENLNKLLQYVRCAINWGCQLKRRHCFAMKTIILFIPN